MAGPMTASEAIALLISVAEQADADSIEEGMGIDRDDLLRAIGIAGRLAKDFDYAQRLDKSTANGGALRVQRRRPTASKPTNGGHIGGKRKPRYTR